MECAPVALFPLSRHSPANATTADVLLFPVKWRAANCYDFADYFQELYDSESRFDESELSLTNSNLLSYAKRQVNKAKRRSHPLNVAVKSERGRVVEPGLQRRQSLIACLGCGHRIANVRTCDAEFKCKQCGCEFEVIIRLIRDSGNSAKTTPPSDHKD
jgi:hypothetical protein